MTTNELLEEILSDRKISDILFDGHLNALVDREGELEKIQPPFHSEIEVEQWARSVMNTNGSRLDIAKPISEVTIKTSEGLIRIHAVLAGECSKRTQISIRRHAVSELTLEDLHLAGSLSQSVLESLRRIVNLRQNFVIIGGTGSGKTTLLKAMLSEVKNERVITVEDSAELNLSGNSISLTTRESNHEGIGAITLGHLLREALRMRPDRLVIGEARGEELLLMLQAMNTGHTGSGFTLHANSVEDLMPRMLAIMSGIAVSAELARILFSSSISWVIEVKRNGTRREVTNIQRLVELEF
jgi:pilus assembly protein CpaF